MPAYAEIEDLEVLSSWCDMKDLTTEQLQNLLERAARWIRRYTGKTFLGETDPDILADLKWANCLLAEYLFIFDDLEAKEGKMLDMQSERIGNYSYQIRDAIRQGVKVGDLTGNEELDSILLSLKTPSQGLNYFGLHGPSRRRRGYS